jgi:hypothetical protein
LCLCLDVVSANNIGSLIDVASPLQISALCCCTLPGICCTPPCERSGEVVGGVAPIAGSVIGLSV